MPKAVLVMDMPESCDMCDLRYTLPFGNKVCYIKLKGVTGQERPDWCPLRELPEHKPTIGIVEESNRLLMNAGWNACLDKILK